MSGTFSKRFFKKTIFLPFVFISLLVGWAPLAHATTATYSATYRAPYCSGSNASCDTGTLVNARGNQTGGPEPNQSNTINDSCTDGTHTGAYHTYESNDRVSIATNDGSPLGPGKAVTVSATVWCRTVADSADFYYTNNVSSPSWTLIGTQVCAASGSAQVNTAGYTLPSAGTTQAVRVQFRYSGASSNACYPGTVNDRDDLVFDLTIPNNASFSSQTPPPLAMTAGQTATVSVTMQNTGTNTWTQASNYRLGSQNPPDNSTWGLSRDNLEVASVPPGSSATFNFTVTAPSTPGTYNFQWQMVQEGVAWFGATSPNVAVTVSLAPDTANPSTPTGVSATAASQSAINLSWNASTDPVVGGQTTSGIAGYWVYRNGSATPVNASLITGTSYTDGGLSTQTGYTYTIRAQDNAGNRSGLSSSAGATTLPPPNVSGHAWAGSGEGADDAAISANPGIGWIKLSGTATDGSPYGVLVSSANPGVLSGYAWANPRDDAAIPPSNNIGWISFNATDVAGCPTAPCTPTLNRTTGAITGWARALGYQDAQAGGWDGWIHLSGSTYGISVSGCNWSGYAWGGGTTIGWIHFGGASYPVTGSGDGCTALPDLTAGDVSENTATVGSARAFTSLITNSPAAGTGTGFTDLLEVDNDSNHALFTDIYDVTKTYASAAIAASGSNTASASYTFPSPGTWYVRFCADTNSSNIGSIAETNENNNCGAWTTVTVTLPELSVTFLADPTLIDPGQHSNLQWTSNADSCTGTGFSTGIGDPPNSTGPGVSTGPLPSNQTNSYPYLLTCKKTGYADATRSVSITIISVTASISAKPSCISGGGSSKIYWSVLPVSQIQPGSCTLSGLGLSPNPLSVSPDGSAPNASPQTAAVTSKSTYTIDCFTKGGSEIKKSIAVDVRSCWTEF